jgi:hypothetical protein
MREDEQNCGVDGEPNTQEERLSYLLYLYRRVPFSK